MKIVDYIVFFILLGVAILISSCEKDSIDEEIIYTPPYKFESISERYSAINETTGYFNSNKNFERYLSKNEFETLVNGRIGSIKYRVMGKDMVYLDANQDSIPDIFGFATSFPDGLPDYTGYGKYFLLNDWSRPSRNKVYYPSNINFSGGVLQVNDFNGDGKDDVIHFSHNSKLNVYIDSEEVGGDVDNPIVGPSIFTFENSTVTQHKAGILMDSHGGASGDIDNDGDIDFIQFPIPGGDSVNTNPRFPFVAINDGNMNFTSQLAVTDIESLYPCGWNTTSLELFDVNNDNYLDLIVSWHVGDIKYNINPDCLTQVATDPVVLWGNGSGQFSYSNSTILPETSLEQLGVQATSLGFGFTDFDNDNDIDIVVVTTRSEPNGRFDNGTYYDNYYLLLFENNGGSFIESTSKLGVSYDQSLSSFGSFAYIRSVDIDDDGDYDLVPDGILSWTVINWLSDVKWENIGNMFKRSY